MAASDRGHVNNVELQGPAYSTCTDVDKGAGTNVAVVVVRAMMHDVQERS